MARPPKGRAFNLGRPDGPAAAADRGIRPTELGQRLDSWTIDPNADSATLLNSIGGRSRTRTYGPLIKSQLLYQLSYAPPPGAEPGS